MELLAICIIYARKSTIHYLVIAWGCQHCFHLGKWSSYGSAIASWSGKGKGGSWRKIVSSQMARRRSMSGIATKLRPLILLLVVYCNRQHSRPSKTSLLFSCRLVWDPDVHLKTKFDIRKPSRRRSIFLTPRISRSG